MTSATRFSLSTLLSISTLPVLGALGCGQNLPDPGNAETKASALSTPGVAVLGFETPAGWTVSSGTVSSSTTTFTQGTAALAVTAPQNYTTLVSAQLKSGLAPLAGLTNVGAAVEVDMELPKAQPNPSYLGALQMYVSCPSRGVYNQYLGQSELTGQQLGTFQTYSFAVSDFVRAKLAGASYTDLTFTLALNAPSGATGKYIFDNLRTRSPATAPVGARPSVDLTALLSQAPKVNTPGVATFAAGTIQIPSSFHVNLGSAGTGTALFALGTGSTTSASCTYAASADKTAYVLSACTTGNVAGDIVAASFAKLTIQSASASAPLTKIVAQLAYDVLGDQVGTKLVPPIPTFWGESGSQISAITQAFGQLEINAVPPSAKRSMSLPIPNFAYRQGVAFLVTVFVVQDPTTAASDPHFSFQGDINHSSDGSPSGLFDGYYAVSGNVNTDDTNQRFTSHFDATAVAGVAVLGSPIEALRAMATVDTDNGGTNAFGSVNPKTTGSFQAYLFGQIFENDPVSGTTGFTFNPTTSLNLDAPPLRIWIFNVHAGVFAEAGVDITGALALNGFQLTTTPHASIGAHVFTSIDLVVVSGGVDVSVELLGVQIPIVAALTVDISTAPGICGASVNFDANGSVVLSAGAGEIDLAGTIGFCPFCLSGSVPIFTWAPVPVANFAFPSPFPVHLELAPVFPPSLCTLPLDVSIIDPLPNETVFAGVNVGASAVAQRPPIGGEAVGERIDCQFMKWTSSDLAATFDPSPIGCEPVVTFGTPGPQTLTATVLDQFNEPGSATVNVIVSPMPQGLLPVILSPFQNEIPIAHNLPPTVAIPIKGNVTGGTGTITATWTSEVAVVEAGTSKPPTHDLGSLSVAAGANVSVNLNKSFLFPIGLQKVTLTVIDAGGDQAERSVTFNPIIIK